MTHPHERGGWFRTMMIQVHREWFQRTLHGLEDEPACAWFWKDAQAYVEILLRATHLPSQVLELRGNHQRPVTLGGDSQSREVQSRHLSQEAHNHGIWQPL
ncbi:hypothetical protein CARUB_v10007635mg [Capsella rubella]|uniref:Uncharacterized protein n=1 Tax=Capsella rubella TaxID=81985 RepID=R0H2X8_9BRAS|nr:hypothetical protein CARUB_v10007635mg [Capsella rubella]